MSTWQPISETDVILIYKDRSEREFPITIWDLMEVGMPMKDDEELEYVRTEILTKDENAS